MNLREYMEKTFTKEEVENINKRVEKRLEEMRQNRQMNMIFIQMVKEKTNMSYEEISKKVRLNKDTIIDMEEGKTAFSFKRIRKMADLLDFSFDFTLTARG